MSDESTLVKELVYDILEYAKELGIHPSEISQAKFLKKYVKYSSYDFKKIGGFRSLINSHFPMQDKDLKTTYENKKEVAYINKLEKRVGELESYYDTFEKKISEKLSDIKIEQKVLDKKTTQDYFKKLHPSDSSDKRSIVTLWTDQHFGASVNKKELAGKNEFNWTIGSRRLAMLCEQVATYKIEKRKSHEELVILLLGDNISGIIHDQEGPDLDMISHQVFGATEYYAQALEYLKQFFLKIRVVCQAGNHGRMMHKSSKDRALHYKMDSYEHMVFNALAHRFIRDTQITLEVSEAPQSATTIQGHRVFGTHGDTVLTVGNVGSTINLRSIEQQILRINEEERKQNREPFKLFCTGHVHHPLITQVGSGAIVTVNGCLIGTDAYAHGVGIHSSRPVQLIWETTKKFVQGDVRHIYVDAADSEEKYSQIITPYDYSLIPQKKV